MLIAETLISRPLAAKIADVRYVTFAYWLSRGLMVEPLELLHVVALAVAGHLRRQGVKFQIVRGVVSFILNQPDGVLRRQFAAGRRYLAIDMRDGNCSLQAEPMAKQKGRGSAQPILGAIVIDLERVLADVQEAVDGATDEA